MDGHRRHVSSRGDSTSEVAYSIIVNVSHVGRKRVVLHVTTIIAHWTARSESVVSILARWKDWSRRHAIWIEMLGPNWKWHGLV